MAKIVLHRSKRIDPLALLSICMNTLLMSAIVNKIRQFVSLPFDKMVTICLLACCLIYYLELNGLLHFIQQSYQARASIQFCIFGYGSLTKDNNLRLFMTLSVLPCFFLAFFSFYSLVKNWRHFFSTSTIKHVVAVLCVVLVLFSYWLHGLMCGSVLYDSGPPKKAEISLGPLWLLIQSTTSNRYETLLYYPVITCLLSLLFNCFFVWLLDKVAKWLVKIHHSVWQAWKGWDTT